MRKVLVLGLILALLGACGTATNEASTSPTPSVSPSMSYSFSTDPAVLGPDLQKYLNNLGTIGTLENEVVGLFDAVSGKNFTTNAQLQKQLDLIIPKAQKFLKQLKVIETKHPEITHFHNQYIDIWQQQVSAFETMSAALENADQDALETAASNVESARSKIAPLQAELQALTEYAGVEIVF